MTEKKAGFSEADIRKVAELARLELSSAEITKFTSQIEKILGYVCKLEELDTKGIEPMSHPLSLETPLRVDEAVPSPGAEKMLASAPEQIYNNYKVPQVMGGET